MNRQRPAQGDAIASLWLLVIFLNALWSGWFYPASTAVKPIWQASSTTVNTLARVTEDETNAAGRDVPAAGVSLGADHVDLLLDGVSQGRATYPGWSDPVGAWSKTLTLGAGAHTLTANAVHPSGHFTANSSFTVHVPLVTVTSAYDDGVVQS